MPQPIMNPNYFNPQYRTPMYGQFMPQQEQFQPQQFMQQPQQNAVQMYGRIVPAQECIEYLFYFISHCNSGSFQLSPVKTFP